MTGEASGDAREQRLQDVLAGYLERLDAGTAEDREVLLARHPEFAAELAEFFAVRDRIDGVAAPLRRATGQGDCLGDFRIVREVGKGGMGIVYEAEQISLHRRVALKVLPFAATMDPRHLQRFHNEAQAAACLHHTNIVPVYFVGCERGVHFYAMQFIEGQSLAELIALQRHDSVTAVASSPHSPAEMTQPIAVATTQAAARDTAHYRRIAAWGIQAAEALDHAHSLGIVHRDIKPSNLMIDGAGKLWVTDFGLARTATDSGLTMTGDVVGTLRYMSPEQALAKHGLVDHRSDIYSLGATLYELLTLRPVVEGKDREEILHKITFAEPPSPRSLDRAIPADLETIILKALAKEPADRYATAREMADDLHRFLEDRPIRARRPSWLQRMRRWFRRHQAVVTAATLTLAIALAVGSVLIWRERDETLSALRDVKVQRQRAEERELLARRQLYAAHIAAAQRAWMVADLSMVKSLLEQHIPRSGEEDLRGFEWYYLWGLLQGRKDPLRTLRGHKGEVYCVQFSPDGKLLATAGQDHTIRLWDPATDEARAVLRGHNHEVNWVAFAPEGGLLASASDDGTVKLWDLASRREIGQILKGMAKVIGVAFSLDGKLLAAGLDDGTVHWWDRTSGRERPSFRAQKGRIESITFSPDGRTLATGKDCVNLWDTATGKLQRSLPESGPNATFVRFSHQGDVVAATSWLSRLQLWNAASGSRLLHFSNPSSDLDSAAFSPDDRILATAGDDAKVRLWNARSGQMLDLLVGHSDRVWCVAFSPDGRTLATTSKDSTVQLWEPDARQHRKKLAGAPNRCRLLFSPDGKRLVGGGFKKNEGRISIWEVPSGRLVDCWSCPDRIDVLALSPDGKTVATGHWGGLVTVWGQDKGRPRLTFQADGTIVDSLAFTADGKTLLTNGGAIVRQWDVSTGHLRRDLTPLRNRGVAYSPARNLVATANSDDIVLFDLTAGSSQILLWPKKTFEYGVAAFSPDGALLAGWIDYSVILWDVASRRVHLSLAGHRSKCRRMTFSGDGKLLASLGEDGEVKLWSVLTGQEMLSLEDHHSPIRSIAFAPNGRMLATSCAVEGGEEEVSLWLTPDGPQEAEPSALGVNGNR